jgi:cobalt/nickel transport system permease protein
MMIGHLTFAGLAEAVISAGMVSYLQRADLSLLRGVTAFARAPGTMITGANGEVSPGRFSPGRLWWVVACLMLFTPLGILAAGTAWGEWSSADLMNPHTREQIGAASGNHAPPSSVPSGIEKLSTVWTAPFPGYAPRFIKSPAFGYLISAMFGVGILVLASLLARVAARKWPGRNLHP